MGLHLPELIVVLVVGLLVFGPKKLPEMGSAIGKSFSAFRKSMNEISNPIDEASPDPVTQEVLPVPNKDMSSLTRPSSTSEEVSTEKQADKSA